MQVQNKAAISANATQHELVQEAAERQRQEDNAAKRLERVHDQQANFISPLAFYQVGQVLPERARPAALSMVEVSQASYLDAWNRLVHELQPAEMLAQFSYEFVKLPAAPWMELLNGTSKATLSAWSKVPFMKLPPADIADIDSDPAKRQRYTELVRASYLPPLRHMADIVHTQVRHQPTLFFLC
jgi:hypothetical protein